MRFRRKIDYNLLLDQIQKDKEVLYRFTVYSLIEPGGGVKQRLGGAQFFPTVQVISELT